MIGIGTGGCSGGDRGAVLVLRRVGEPDQLPDGAAGPLQRRGGRRRQRMVGDGLPDAAAGRLRRRLMAGALPIHHPRRHSLRPGMETK